MKKAIVVGSGAGGATAAKELQGKFEVTVLEAGREFRPFSYRLSLFEKAKSLGLFFDEREIQLLFPAMKIRKTKDMVLVTGRGTGGSTTIATANALRLDGGLKKLGIDLDDEFEEIRREIPISAAHENGWRAGTRRLFEVFRTMGLEPWPAPKMGDPGRCVHCGRCILGCPSGAKWDSRRFLNQALGKGARVITGCAAERIIIDGGEATGVEARLGRRRRFFGADLIILAAGGLGTPFILKNSGIACRPGLFVDPVLCVAAERPDAGMDREVPMPFIIERDGFFVSPYFDYLSFFFNRRWSPPARNILSLMIKFADSPQGDVTGRRIQKTLSKEDKERLRTGIALCGEIFKELGIRMDETFLGTVNAGHPGGMLPLTAEEASSFHPPALPSNVYVADSSLLPEPLGRPPILTIIAMAKRVSRICRDLH
jgi:choline dehydrogenase-like flavoprotein